MEQQRKKVAVDVDDVLCRFTPAAFKFHGKKMPDKIHYWCVDTMDKALCKGWFSDFIALDSDFWGSLEPLSNPKDIDFEIDYYISSFPPTMYAQRANWLKIHGFPNKPLIVSSDKVEVCKRLGIDVLVDDKPQTIQAINDAGLIGIHFITEYADFEPVGERYVTNLKQVKNYL